MNNTPISGAHAIIEVLSKTSDDNIAPIVSLIDRENDDTLLKSNLEGIANDDVVKYLACLLSISLGHNEKSLMRRKCIYLTGINIVANGTLGEQFAVKLFDNLFLNMTDFVEVHARCCVELVLKLMSSDRVNNSSYRKLLDILPRLVIRALGNYRDQAFDKLISLPWNPGLVVSITITAIELLSNESECEELANKLREVLVNSRGYILHGFDPQDIPPLIFQLALMSRKFPSEKRVQMSILRNISVIVEGIVNSTVASGGHGSYHSVLPNIASHLSFLIAKDQVDSTIRIIHITVCNLYDAIARTGSGQYTSARNT